MGPRCAMFGGCFIFGLGAALTYFTLDAGLPAVAFTYGFVSASANIEGSYGISYAGP